MQRRIVEVPLEDKETLGFSVHTGVGEDSGALAIATNAQLHDKPEDDYEAEFTILPRPPESGDDTRIVVASLDICEPGLSEFRLVSTDVGQQQQQKPVLARGFLIAEEPESLHGPRRIPLSGVSVQTVITKLLGPVDSWKRHFETAEKCGYNAVHFTPVQPLGISNSSYSVYEQLDVSQELFAKGDPAGRTTESRVAALRAAVNSMRADFGLMAIADVVLPHTAVNSPWLLDHPEAGYSLRECPHLQPAFVVDCALRQFSNEVAAGAHGGNAIASGADIARLTAAFKAAVLPRTRLWEYYALNVDLEIAAFNSPSTKKGVYHTEITGAAPDVIASVVVHTARRVPGVGRNSLRLDPAVLSAFTNADQLRKAVNDANLVFFGQYDDDVAAILKNVGNQLEWEFLNERGPRRTHVTKEEPLVSSYFTVLGGNTSALHVALGADVGNISAVANHGWVMDGNPAVDFAGPESRAYVRREVIVWSDSVKLRYGARREDNPWLWDHMASYVRMMAGLFDGFRIDNAHSVPLATLQFLMWQARKENPDLVIFAELFAPSHEAGLRYTASCGIHALLREASHPRSLHDFQHMIYEMSGATTQPIGRPPQLPRGDGRHMAIPMPVPGWVFDLTHDNEPFTVTRTAVDALSTAALVAMCATPTGSVRGLDEMLPFKVDVVREHRRYRDYPWDDRSFVPPGIMRAKKLVCTLHERLAKEGYTEAYAQCNGPLVSAARQHPVTHSTVNLFAFPSFKGTNPNEAIPPVTLSGICADVEFVCTVSVEGEGDITPETHVPSSDAKGFLDGMRTHLRVLEHPAAPGENEFVAIEQHERTCTIRFKHFPPGSVMCVRCEMTPSETSALHRLYELLASKTLTGNSGEVGHIFHGVPLEDMNVVLYRCEDEQRAESPEGAYDVPNYGKPAYTGLQGWQSALESALHRFPVDLGHPFFENIRQGNWAFDYTIRRLQPYPRLFPLQNWLSECLECLKQQPRHLLPKFFALVNNAIYNASVAHCVSKMSPFVRDGSPFIRSLAMGSVQLYSCLRSSPFIDPAIAPGAGHVGSLAAGLPHFSHGYMRSWGRDTFISLKGLLLVTGRHSEAHGLLIGAASCVRHGLIPNLIDSGRKPRYNARDATWWFLNALVDYCELVQNGASILGEPVWRLFPKEAWKHAEWSTMAETVQEIMTAHANGISFRERNAGPEIDSKMQSQGFDISIQRDPKTGFLHGGNALNCGTWMDKMGESHKAGNHGVPATPRDGAPVEIVGLLKRVLTGLASLYTEKRFPYDGVALEDGSRLSYSEWAAQIADSFHEHFFVPMDSSNDARFHVRSEWANRRGIYRDTVGSTSGWTDYQLRPNFCVAMAVAPELFLNHASEARTALATVGSTLRGPLGMKTLDPSDWNYRGVYSSEDTEDKSTSCGYNYHQGPEWVWPFGFYLQALILHGDFKNFSDRNSAVLSILKPHMDCIQNAPWYALPELTNADGAYCAPSCQCQAWSMATILDALHLLHLKSSSTPRSLHQ